MFRDSENIENAWNAWRTAKVDFENIVFPVHVPMVCIDSDLQLYGDMRKAVKKLTQSKDPSSPSYLEIFIWLVGSYDHDLLLGSLGCLNKVL